MITSILVKGRRNAFQNRQGYSYNIPWVMLVVSRCSVINFCRTFKCYIINFCRTIKCIIINFCCSIKCRIVSPIACRNVHSPCEITQTCNKRRKYHYIVFPLRRHNHDILNTSKAQPWYIIALDMELLDQVQYMQSNLPNSSQVPGTHSPGAQSESPSSHSGIWISC